MCRFCEEAIGLEVCAAALRRDPLPDGADAPFWRAILVQEGLDAPPTAAPVTRRCRAVEAEWRSEHRLPRLVLPEADALGPWRTPRRPEDPTAHQEAMDLLWRYVEWSGHAKDGDSLAEAFPALWCAWLLVEERRRDHDVLRLIRALASARTVPTEERLELWLQRRAALAWCDTEGLDALLSAYGRVLRAHLVHYAALHRPPDRLDRARLIEVAGQHGEAAQMSWVLGEEGVAA